VIASFGIDKGRWDMIMTRSPWIPWQFEHRQIYESRLPRATYSAAHLRPEIASSTFDQDLVPFIPSRFVLVSFRSRNPLASLRLKS